MRNGSLQLLGKVGEVDPPHLVMPLTIEPSKPRLCHDERFLNLWMRDCPFSLETLRDVPRLIQKDGYMTSIDDKSGYDHVLLSENSRNYFGIQFRGYSWCTERFHWVLKAVHIFIIIWEWLQQDSVDS